MPSITSRISLADKHTIISTLFPKQRWKHGPHGMMEITAGDVYGNPGRSFHIREDGLWKDFAVEGHQGDLIDLLKCRFDMSFTEAANFLESKNILMDKPVQSTIVVTPERKRYLKITNLKTRPLPNTWDYYYETQERGNYNLLIRVTRTNGQKSPRRWTWNGNHWQPGNAHNIHIQPYRLPDILESATDSRPILLVEGEKTADAFYQNHQLQSAFACATTFLGGANPASGTELHYLKDRIVHILGDNDDAGDSFVRKAVELCFQVTNAVYEINAIQMYEWLGGDPNCCPEKWDIADPIY